MAEGGTEDNRSRPYRCLEQQFFEVCKALDQFGILLSYMFHRIFRILAAQFEDSGLYRCVAENRLGRVFEEAELTVLGTTN